MPDGAIRHLHANHLRKFKIRVQGVGVTCDDVDNQIREVECCETGIGINEDIVTELTRAKLKQRFITFNRGSKRRVQRFNMEIPSNC